MMNLFKPSSSVLLVVVSFHWASETAFSSCVAFAAMRTTPRILPLEASSAVGKSSQATIQPAPIHAPASYSSSSSLTSSSPSSASSLLTACVPPPKNKYAALTAAVCVGTTTPQDATASQFDTHRRELDWYAYTTTTPTVAVAARTPEQEERRGPDKARTDNEERKVVHLASWRPGKFVDGAMTDPPDGAPC